MSPAARNALEAVAGEAAWPSKARLYARPPRKRESNASCSSRPKSSVPAARAMQSGPYFDVASASMPCRSIGGDFFDYFNLPDGQFAFAWRCGGQGPPAALLTAMVQGAFAAQVTSTDSPAALMAHINRTLIRRAIQSRFVTVMRRPRA